MHRFLQGLRSYGPAAGLVFKAGLWVHLLIPGLIALLYFPAVVWVALVYGGSFAAYVRDHWLPEFLRNGVMVGLITVTLGALGIYTGFMLFRNVVMILYAPVLTYMSARTEAKARPGVPLSDAGEGIVRGAVRGITMSLASLALAVACLILCLFLLLVPIIGQLGMIVLLPLTQMFLAGHGFIDPTLERRALGVRDSLRFAWRHRLVVAGCGCGFVLLSLVPVIGWCLGPTLGVVTGTLVALDLLQREQPASSP
jgi:CysZ protein